MHLTSDPVALLRGGHEAHVVEEDCRVEAQDELVGDLLGLPEQVLGPAAGPDEQHVPAHLVGTAEWELGHTCISRWALGDLLTQHQECGRGAVRGEQVDSAATRVDEDGGLFRTRGRAECRPEIGGHLRAVQSDPAAPGEVVQL